MCWRGRKCLLDLCKKIENKENYNNFQIVEINKEY